MKQKLKTITLGELRQALKPWANSPDDTPVFFGGGDVSLYRLKNRGGGSDMIQFEFNELYTVTLDPSDHD